VLWTDLKGPRDDTVDWNQLSQSRVQIWNLLETITNLRILYDMGMTWRVRLILSTENEFDPRIWPGEKQLPTWCYEACSCPEEYSWQICSKILQIPHSFLATKSVTIWFKMLRNVKIEFLSALTDYAEPVGSRWMGWSYCRWSGSYGLTCSNESRGTCR
jgi:hypothetical protein